MEGEKNYFRELKRGDEKQRCAALNGGQRSPSVVKPSAKRPEKCPLGHLLFVALARQEREDLLKQQDAAGHACEDKRGDSDAAEDASVRTRTSKCPPRSGPIDEAVLQVCVASAGEDDGKGQDRVVNGS